MKKMAVEFSLYFLGALLYLMWRERNQLRRSFNQLNDEYVEQVKTRRAIENTLRSIKGLPETDA